MAGGVGIEPTQAVLETAVLPLYEPPKNRPHLRERQLFGFLVQSFLFAELAEFLELQAFLGILLILFGLVVEVMANRALQVNQVVL